MGKQTDLIGDCVYLAVWNDGVIDLFRTYFEELKFHSRCKSFYKIPQNNSIMELIEFKNKKQMGENWEKLK